MENSAWSLETVHVALNCSVVYTIYGALQTCFGTMR